MALELRKASPVRLRSLDLDERWLQDRIAEDPSLLGLGDLQIVRRERNQPTGGMHTGELIRTAAGYTGLHLIRGARIKEAGHGGRVLVSKAAAALIEDALIDGLSLRDLGAHRLKGLPHPERIFQLIIPDLPADFRPLRSLDTRWRAPKPGASAGADDGTLRRHGRRDGTARRAGRPPVARTASAVCCARTPGAGPPRRGEGG